MPRRAIVDGLDQQGLRYSLTHCPECQGPLNTLISSDFMRDYDDSYCPGCDIMKRTSINPAYLCGNCDSTIYYSSDRKKSNLMLSVLNELHSELMGMKNQYRVFDKDGQKGYADPIRSSRSALPTNPLEEEKYNHLRDRMGKMLRRLPKDVCWLCGDDDFHNLSDEEFSDICAKDLGHGGFRDGYRMSDMLSRTRTLSCTYGHSLPAFLINHKDDVFSCTCVSCTEKMFVELPREIVRSFRDIGYDTSVISIDEARNLQKIKEAGQQGEIALRRLQAAGKIQLR
jgi:hypothetical protein